MTRFGISTTAAALIVGGVISMVLIGCSRSTTLSEGPEGSQAKAGVETPAVDQNEGAGKGMAALRQASASGKYLFAFFFKAEDEQTVAMRKVFDKTMDRLANRAERVAVNVTEAPEKAVVDKFGLSGAPMPLVLAIAPNGAVTGGFPTKFEEQQLMEAFASPATEKCMKSLQDGKLVFLCIQNEKTKSNDAAMKGVNEFKADERFAHATTVMSVDPTDKKEASFLADLQVPSRNDGSGHGFSCPSG